MNFKKKIIFTGLSLLLSSTFNSAYSAHKPDESTGDCLARPFKKSRGAQPIYTVEDAREGEGGGASSSASSAGKTPGDWAGLPLEGLAATPSNAPRGWEQHVRTGVAYFREGSFLDAIAQFTAALAIEGIDMVTKARCLNQLGASHFNLGNAYFKKGKFLEAIDQYTAALAIEGIDGKTRANCLDNLLKTHFNMAFEYLHQKNDDESSAQFRLASRVMPEKTRSMLDSGMGIRLVRHVISSGYIEVAKCFFDAGARVDAVDNEGKTALHCAAEQYRGSVEIGTFLLERGANVNAADNEGKTALMHAVESFQDNQDYLEQLKTRVMLLINSGADIGIKDKEGRTVFDLCKQESLRQFINEAKEQYDCRVIG